MLKKLALSVCLVMCALFAWGYEEFTDLDPDNPIFNTLTLTGNATIGGNLSLTGTALFKDRFYVGATAGTAGFTVTPAGVVIASNAVSLNGNLSVGQNSQSNWITAVSTMGCGGNFVVGGTLKKNTGSLTVESDLIFNDGGSANLTATWGMDLGAGVYPVNVNHGVGGYFGVKAGVSDFALRADTNTIRYGYVPTKMSTYTVDTASFDIGGNGSYANNLSVAQTATIKNAVVTSSLTVTGATVIGTKTIAQLKVYTPIAVGEMWRCSDSTPPSVYVATGTTEYGFGKVTIEATD